MGATCLGARDVGHLFSPVARIACSAVPSTGLVLYLSHRWRKAHPEGVGEALKGWLTDVAAEVLAESIRAE